MNFDFSFPLSLPPSLPPSSLLFLLSLPVPSLPSSPPPPSLPLPPRHLVVVVRRGLRTSLPGALLFLLPPQTATELSISLSRESHPTRAATKPTPVSIRPQWRLHPFPLRIRGERAGPVQGAGLETVSVATFTCSLILRLGRRPSRSSTWD